MCLREKDETRQNINTCLILSIKGKGKYYLQGAHILVRKRNRRIRNGLINAGNTQGGGGLGGPPGRGSDGQGASRNPAELRHSRARETSRQLHGVLS